MADNISSHALTRRLHLSRHSSVMMMCHHGQDAQLAAAASALKGVNLSKIALNTGSEEEAIMLDNQNGYVFSLRKRSP